jgi:hypothetical protein
MVTRPGSPKKKSSKKNKGIPSEEIPEDVPHYTTSVDASVPGENIVSVQLEESSGRWIAVNRGPDGRLYIGGGNTEPLARRVAGLRAIKAQEHREENIPASGRYVGPDHNSTEFKELIEVLDRLTSAIEENNEYAASDPNDQDRRLAEVRSAKNILTSASSIGPAFLAAIASSLTYLCLKFSDAVIGKTAEQAFELLQQVFGS